MACQSCRSRKIKCDRNRPVCQNCKLRSVDCTYAGERRTKRWIQAGIDTRRFSVIRNTQRHPQDEPGDPQGREIISRKDPTATATTPGGHHDVTTTADPTTQSEGQDVEMTQSQPPWSQMECDPMGCGFDQNFNNMSASLQTPTSFSSGGDEHLLDKILGGDDMEGMKDRNPAVWMRTPDGDEYTGPSSGISTISDLGLSWVRDNVADSQVLCETIQDIRNGVLNRLRQPKCIPQVHSPPLDMPCVLKDTPETLVRSYVDAYFDTVQVVFPILDRDTFFSQLDSLGTGHSMSQSPSWQALLSAVLASGCRASLSAETADAFRTSGREAWAYFHKALSFESCIFHGSTDLMAVQAMAVMTVYAQGLSSPQRLEYTLCSIASRLAQSLALNRHPSPEWHLTEDEKHERNRVFWTIYCLDRSISLRSGRPAVISDDDISCRFPRGISVIQHADDPRPAAQNASHVDFFLCFTKLSRICGNVSRMLYSASALYTPSPRLLPTMNHLLHDLHSWLGLIPLAIQPGKPPNRMTETFGLSRPQIIVLHLSYYYVLCAIYRRFTPLFTQESKSLQHLMSNDMHCSHIEAARSMVLLTKHLDIESFTPAWLVFYYPFTALTTIFVHIVTYPLNHTAQSDIALMETVVGFFGRLEYVTSGEAAFTKTAEFVRQARNVTNRSAQNLAKAGQKSPSHVSRHSPFAEVLVAGPDSIDDTEDGRPRVQPASSSQDHDELSMPESDNGNVRATPLLMESLRDEGIAVNQSSTCREMNVIQHDHSLCTDLSGFLAPPAGDSIQVNWLDDWASAV